MVYTASSSLDGRRFHPVWTTEALKEVEDDEESGYSQNTLLVWELALGLIGLCPFVM